MAVTGTPRSRPPQEVRQIGLVLGQEDHVGRAAGRAAVKAESASSNRSLPRTGGGGRASSWALQRGQARRQGVGPAGDVAGAQKDNQVARLGLLRRWRPAHPARPARSRGDGPSGAGLDQAVAAGPLDRRLAGRIDIGDVTASASLKQAQNS